MLARRTKIYAGLTAAVAISMLGVGIVTSGIPGRVIYLSGGDSSLVGLVASCYALPFVLFQIPFGNLADRYGFKPFLLMGYILAVLSGLIFYFGRTPAMMFLGRAVQGTGEIPVLSMAVALISIEYPEKKGKMIGIYTAVIYVMLAIGPLLVPALPHVFGETGGFLFFSALSVLSVFIIFFTQENRGPVVEADKESFELKRALALLSDAPVRIALLGILLYGAGLGIILSIIPGWLTTVKAYSKIEIGALFSAYFLCYAAAQFVFGPLSDKYGRKLFMVAGLLISTLGWLLFPNAPKAATIGLLAISAGALGGFFVASMAFMNERAPDHLKGTISGAYYLFWGAGYFFGPIICGLAGRSVDLKNCYYFFAMLLLATAVAIIFIRDKRATPIH
ncbi:MFS transporter [Synergistaceae bacterium OttesenSCG-928-D05]|nr:MFS transporter [Synergistaceae bacterium OttesenSCG-928-D05]